MTKQQYDDGWDTQWDDKKRFGPFSRHIRRLIDHSIAELTFDTVLDVGCGQGALLMDIAEKFPHVALNGTDLSSRAVQLAQGRVPNGCFAVLDLTREALERKFDLVICSEVLEHIPEDVKALENIRRMTAEYLLVTTPQGRMRRFEVGVGHVRNYARGELQTKLRATGFEPISVIEWGFPWYSPLYRDYLDFTNDRGTTGEFGVIRKALALGLYQIFLLNSWKRGDELVVLSRAVG